MHLDLLFFSGALFPAEDSLEEGVKTAPVLDPGV